MKSDLKQAVLAHFNGNFEGFYQRYLPSESLKSLKRENNGEFKCLCCFHNDTEPSLNLNYETGVWNCFGEKVGGDIFSFYARKHNLNTKTDFQKILAGVALDFGIDNGQSRTQGLGKIVKTYDYPDEQGKLVFQVVKYKPKDFRQRRPGGKGEWIWNLKGVKPVLYNLPAVLKASEVLVCEGEKDCDRLNTLGLIATTNPQGAGKWRKEYTKTLAGKDIVLFPHNDDPGKEHMLKVASELHAVARSVKIIVLPVENKGGDVCDWLDALGDDESGVERLSLMIEVPEPWQPTEEQNTDKTDETTGQLISLKQVQPQSLGDLLAIEFPAPAPIIENLLNEEEMAVFAGPKKLGKTVFTQNMTLSIANGTDFLGFRVPAAQRVLYIQQEVAPRWFKERLEHMMEALPDGPAKDNFHHVSRRGIVLTDPKTLSIVGRWIEQTKPRLVIFDPLYLFHSGEENSARDMTKFFRPIFKLVEDYGVSVWTVHHHGKPGQLFSGYDDSDKSRGSSVIGGATDVNIAMTRITGKKYKLDGPMANYATISFEFRNLGPREEIVIYRNPETLFYELVNVALAKKVTYQDVASYVADHKPILRKDLIKALQAENEASHNTVIEAIRGAEEKKLILGRRLKTKGKPIQFILPEDDEIDLFK